MEKESEDKKGEKTVEEKIDLLIAESENAKLERKRERVLSKVDGLYNVLIALSTFLVGLVISQHGFFVHASRQCPGLDVRTRHGCLWPSRANA